MMKMRVVLYVTLVYGLLSLASHSRADPLGGSFDKFFCNGNSTLTCGVSFTSDPMKGLVKRVTVDIYQYVDMDKCSKDQPELPASRIYDQSWTNGTPGNSWESTGIGCIPGRVYHAVLTITYADASTVAYTSTCVVCCGQGSYSTPMITPIGTVLLVISMVTVGAVVLGRLSFRQKKLPKV